MAAISKVSSVFRPNLFKNKVALVTGGGTGIGKAITLELLYLGCKVMVASRNVDRLQQSVEEIKHAINSQGKGPADIHHLQCDIRKEDQIKHMISSTIEQYGKLDYLVNNSGGQFPSPASKMSLKGWNAVVETNLTGTFLCCREAFNQWMAEHGGVIVNVIVDTIKAFPLGSHTGAARAGVENMMKSLTVEWAQNGVRMNSVAPGSSIYSDTAASNYENKMFEKVIPSIPAKRLGMTEEVSTAVCFLLSPSAAFISGNTIRIDGGQSHYPAAFWEIPDHNKIPPYRWGTDDGENGTRSEL